MADLATITAVRPTSDTVIELVVYGATISAGQCVYFDTSDSEYKLADSDNTSTTASVKGVAITPGVDGGYGYIAKKGSIVLVGTTAAVGETYYVSNTPGGIAPDADIGTGDFISRIGTASSATQLALDLSATGITHA